mmetsp:Transcript_104729/g.312838  ORF Transcript_104729/g.312838 Transcript_104729/m.312838 type:complete len:260 (-) Transcript_104729:430-1209(-)
MAEGELGQVRVDPSAGRHRCGARVQAEARPDGAAASEASQEATATAAHLCDVAALHRHPLKEVQVELQRRTIDGPTPGILAKDTLGARRNGILLPVSLAVSPVHEVEAPVTSVGEVVEESVPDRPLQVLEPLPKGLPNLLPLALTHSQAAVAGDSARQEVHHDFQALYTSQPLEDHLKVPREERVVGSQGGVVLHVVPAVNDESNLLGDGIRQIRLRDVGRLVNGRDLAAPEAKDAPKGSGEEVPEVAKSGGQSHHHQG